MDYNNFKRHIHKEIDLTIIRKNAIIKGEIAKLVLKEIIYPDMSIPIPSFDEEVNLIKKGISVSKILDYIIEHRIEAYCLHNFDESILQNGIR